MNVNEFEVCFYLFKNCFEGKTVGEIFPNCMYGIFENIPVNDLIICNVEKTYRVGINGITLFIYRDYDPDGFIILTRTPQNIKIKTVKAFLNYFKIYLEDIV